MANEERMVKDIAREAQGGSVVDVHYTFPNGWLAKQIAPIPPESQLELGGEQITHIIKGSPFGARIELIQGVDQQTAEEILKTAKG